METIFIHHRGFYFEASKGNSHVIQIKNNVRLYDFRADKPVFSGNDLQDVSERFLNDPKQFDRWAHGDNGKLEFFKANRDYSSLILKHMIYHEITYKVNGLEIQLNTASSVLASSIKKIADEILKHEQYSAICLVDDSNFKVFGIHKILPEPELPF